MSKPNNYMLRLGIFVTTSLVIFIIAAYFIGNNQNLFKATFRIRSIFSNVNGLQKGNNVRYAGIRVGIVEEISIVNDSTLEVIMVLEEKVKGFIKKDALASIGSDGLVGSMIVNISPGNGVGDHVEDGDILASYSRLKPQDIMNTLGKTNENVAVLANNLLTMTEEIVRGQGTVSTLLRDTVMSENLRQSLNNLEATTVYLRNTSRQLDQLLLEVNEGNGLLATLVRDTSIKEKVDQMLVKMDEQLLGKVDSIMENIDQSAENMVSFSKTLDQFSQELNRSDGLVGTVLQDTAMSNDLRAFLENLNTGSVMLNENLEAMRQHVLFRKYFKEQEKEEKRKKNDGG